MDPLCSRHHANWIIITEAAAITSIPSRFRCEALLTLRLTLASTQPSSGLALGISLQIVWGCKPTLIDVLSPYKFTVFVGATSLRLGKVRTTSMPGIHKDNDRKNAQQNL